jgi:hypothetical protein
VTKPMALITFCFTSTRNLFFETARKDKTLQTIFLPNRTPLQLKEFKQAKLDAKLRTSTTQVGESAQRTGETPILLKRPKDVSPAAAQSKRQRPRALPSTQTPATTPNKTPNDEDEAEVVYIQRVTPQPQSSVPPSSNDHQQPDEARLRPTLESILFSQGKSPATTLTRQTKSDQDTLNLLFGNVRGILSSKSQVESILDQSTDPPHCMLFCESYLNAGILNQTVAIRPEEYSIARRDCEHYRHGGMIAYVRK